MAVEVAPVRLSVLGPPDLLVTALVAGLGVHGVDAERLAPHEVGRCAAPFPRSGPGVLIVDIDVAGPAGTIPGAVRAGLTVLVIGSETNRVRAAAAIAAGAVGWIRKTTSITVLAETVRAAAGGRMHMSEETHAGWLAEHRSASDSARADVDRLEQLSPREREVLAYLADGLRAAEISALLFLSITTVRSHIRSILVKLGVNSQQAAADVYRQTARRLARMLGAGSGT